MNVTAKHGQAAVHLGGREMNNGRWSPVCGTQHHNAGGREVTPLRPTDKPVTCKRCLKTIAMDEAKAAVTVKTPAQVLVTDVETAPDVAAFHRKLKAGIGLTW